MGVALHLTGYTPSPRELKAGTLRQELKERPWRNAVYLFAFSGFSDFDGLLSYTIQDHRPRGGTIHKRLGPVI